jgi:hypothetical protein
MVRPVAAAVAAMIKSRRAAPLPAAMHVGKQPPMSLSRRQVVWLDWERLEHAHEKLTARSAVSRSRELDPSAQFGHGDRGDDQIVIRGNDID